MITRRLSIERSIKDKSESEEELYVRSPQRCLEVKELPLGDRSRIRILRSREC
jgi:hypothetical protein